MSKIIAKKGRYTTKIRLFLEVDKTGRIAKLPLKLKTKVHKAIALFVVTYHGTWRENKHSCKMHREAWKHYVKCSSWQSKTRKKVIRYTSKLDLVLLFTNDYDRWNRRKIIKAHGQAMWLVKKMPSGHESCWLGRHEISSTVIWWTRHMTEEAFAPACLEYEDKCWCFIIL